MQSFGLSGGKQIIRKIFMRTGLSGAARYKSEINKLRVFNFLMGLNPEYDQARAQILGRAPFPTLMQPMDTRWRVKKEVMLYTPSEDRMPLAVVPPTWICNKNDEPEETNRNVIIIWRLEIQKQNAGDYMVFLFEAVEEETVLQDLRLIFLRHNNLPLLMLMSKASTEELQTLRCLVPQLESSLNYTAFRYVWKCFQSYWFSLLGHRFRSYWSYHQLPYSVFIIFKMLM